MSIAVTASSQLAADAGAEMAGPGGNAVDAAVAAAFASIVSEPGVCSFGCGAHILVWPPDQPPTALDGWVAIPGRSGTREVSEQRVHMDYGGGVETIVGAASVAVPGGPAALADAVAQFGQLGLADCLAPAAAIAESGFGLPAACHHYLQYSADAIYGLDRTGWAALHRPDGSLKAPGETVQLPELAQTLRRLAQRGMEDLYRGELAQLIVNHLAELGGLLSLEDLANYEVIRRQPLQTTMGEWSVATTPPPAIGGSALVAMLDIAQRAGEKLPAGDALYRGQRIVLDYRRQKIDGNEAWSDALKELLERCRESGWALESPSTVHVSAADSDGLLCAITLSSGYGAGIMPAGTGIWLNNCLGELELNAAGLGAKPPGARLASNMAPTVMRSPDGYLALGSPGADRITTALQQVLFSFLNGVAIDTAIDRPRMHLEFESGQPCLAFEPGAQLPSDGPPLRPFDAPSMFFGGVGVAGVVGGKLLAHGDRRRAAGVATAP